MSSPGGPSSSSPSRLGVVLAELAGAVLAGFAVGTTDGALSAIPMAELVTPMGVVATLLFLGAGYAMLGGSIGAAWIVLRALLGRTILGAGLRALRDHYRAARAEAPERALGPLSLALVAPPVLGVVVALAYAAAVADLAARKHMGLVIAVAMVVAVAALALGVLVASMLAALLEGALARWVRRPGMLRVLAAPATSVVVLVSMACCAAGAAVFQWQETLEVLRIRPYVAAASLGLVVPVAVSFGRLLAPLFRRVRWLAAMAYVVLFATPLPTAMIAGSRDGVVAAADRYSGLGDRITALLRAGVDLDRDGYSGVLGGGDCDDFDASVHPGATEVPGDGIDQNCVGGDATGARALTDVGFVSVPRGVPKDFNVVVLTIDTIRADHLGVYGYKRKTTPVIDAIANQGALFLNGWAHAPSTRYSMPAIFTGRYPLAVFYDYSSGAWPGVQGRAITLPEIHKKRGFTTGGIFNYWYFNESTNLDQGFDHYDNENKRLHRNTGRRGPEQTRGSSSRQQTDKALAFVDAHAEGRFFLWVHYYDPHYAYEAHAEVEDFGKEKVDLYDSEIAFTDMHIGRLVDRLKERALYEKTVIVITGDHGEGFGEHGVDLHGYDLYAPQTKVPFIIRVPGIPPRKVKTPVGHVDILPTLANLAGGKPNPQMQGRSLVDVITGNAPEAADRWVFQQLSHGPKHELRGGVSQQCHVLFNVSPQNTWELYRIDRDPAETRESMRDPGPCKDARTRLEAWYEQSQLEQQQTGSVEIDHLDEGGIDVAFGKDVRLVSVELSTREATPFGRTRKFEVKFELDARGALNRRDTLVTTFRAENGGLFRDRRTLGGLEKPGKHTVEQSITVPSAALAGRYIAWVSVYRGKKRLPATGGKGNRAVLNEHLGAAVGAVAIKR